MNIEDIFNPHTIYSCYNVVTGEIIGSNFSGNESQVRHFLINCIELPPDFNSSEFIFVPCKAGEMDFTGDTIRLDHLPGLLNDGVMYG